MVDRYKYKARPRSPLPTAQNKVLAVIFWESSHMPDFGKAHMMLNLWPGYGVSRTGFHFAHGLPAVPTRIHSHPVVDECLILWAGKGQL